jgi:hypothetical protein
MEYLKNERGKGDGRVRGPLSENPCPELSGLE